MSKVIHTLEKISSEVYREINTLPNYIPLNLEDGIRDLEYLLLEIIGVDNIH